MNTEQIIQLVAACSSGLGVIIAFIVSFVKIFGTGKKLKLLSQTFEAARDEWTKKEVDYKNTIIELKTTIAKQELQLSRFEELIKQYQNKLLAYENRAESKFINELETKLANLKNAELESDYKLLEVKKLLEIEKNKFSTAEKELANKNDQIKNLKLELEEIHSLKRNAEELTNLINRKIIPAMKKETPKEVKKTEEETSSSIII